MGALHAGHASLIQAAAQQRDQQQHRACRKVIVSIFVNPAQFAPSEDFDCYPRDLAADYALAVENGADYIFAPDVREIYPHYPQLLLPDQQQLRPSLVARRWEGQARPGHFEGVVTVVKRLFDLVKPDHAYFGEKDFQQLRVIEDMTAQLQLPTKIVRCHTVRDATGLALSSRNRHLSAAEKNAATSIPRALHAVGDAVRAATETLAVAPLLQAARMLLDDSISVDYLAIVDQHSLEPLTQLTVTNDAATEAAIDPKTGARIMFAGQLGSVRLLDNLPL